MVVTNISPKRESLNSFFGSAEVAERLKRQDPEKFGRALEKIHIFGIDGAHRTAHEELDRLRLDVNKSPEEKLDALLNFAETPSNTPAATTAIAAAATMTPEEKIAQAREKLSDRKKTMTENFKAELSEKGDLESMAVLESINTLEEYDKIIKDPNTGFKDKIWTHIKKWFLGATLGGMLGFGGSKLYKDHQAELDGISADDVDDHEKNSEGSEKGGALKYSAGIKVILKTSNNDTPKTEAIFTNDSIKTTNVNDLLRVQESTTPLKKSLNLTDDIDEDEARIALGIIKSKQGLIDSILSDDLPNWREKKLYIVIQELASYGNVLNELNPDKLSKLVKGGIFGSLSFNKNQPVGGSLGDLFEKQRNNKDSKLHGVSEGLLSEIYISHNKTKLSAPNASSSLRNNSFDTKEDIEFEKDLLEFGENFLNNIKNYFFIGESKDKGEFGAYFDNRSLTLKEILEFYIITKGGRDPQGYNTLAKTIIYPKVWGMLGEENGANSLRAKTYNQVFINGVEDGIEGVQNIPSETRDYVSQIQEKAVGGLIEGMKKTLDVAYEGFLTLSLPKQILLGTGIAVGGFALLRTRVFMAKASGIAIGVQTAGVIAAYIAASAWADPTFRKNHPELQSENETTEAIKKDILNAENKA
ncbi:hypothetical protein OAN96_01120 [Candidatus Gracilibacteria bacterium]|nr:hypothetical protein [Candidatus Gracilibacteria bacterium]